MWARLYNHISDVYKGKKTHKANWIKSLINNNKKPILKVIDIVLTKEWGFWEKYWIQQLRIWGFNLVNQGNGGEGLTFGNQTSFKKGSVSWNKGKTYKSSRKYLAISEETKMKISNTLKGRKSLKCRKIKQYDKNMNFIAEFNSITEARNTTKIKSISNVLSGFAKTAGGYIWE